MTVIAITTRARIRAEIEAHEARIEFMLDALPEKIRDAFYETVFHKPTCTLDWVDGDPEQLLFQVFAAWCCDPDSDLCRECGHLMYEHTEFDGGLPWSGPRVVLACPGECD